MKETEALNAAHGAMVEALAKDGHAILNEMTPGDAHLLHMVVGASGEVGELLDAVKKSVIYRKPLDMANVVEELGDIEFYLRGLRDHLGITREETLEANMTKLNTRYGVAYSNDAAQARADRQ